MPSRTYRILMTWSGNPDSITLEEGVTYRTAMQFLNDLQRTWSKRGIENVRISHNHLIVYKLSVWFEEEK
jgi:hypothetical protein